MNGLEKRVGTLEALLPLDWRREAARLGWSEEEAIDETMRAVREGEIVLSGVSMEEALQALTEFRNSPNLHRAKSK